MSKSKKDSVTEQTTKLNEDLLDQFTNELEVTINKVCERNPDQDPRLELAVTLGLFAAQVSIDSGFNKEEFLTLMADMYDDSSSEPDILSIN